MIDVDALDGCSPLESIIETETSHPVDRPMPTATTRVATGRALGDPGRRGRRPTEARSQFLGHDLDGRAGAALLAGPAPLLPAAHDPAALGQGSKRHARPGRASR